MPVTVLGLGLLINVTSELRSEPKTPAVSGAVLLGVYGISGVIEIPAFLQVSDTLQVEERELYHSITYLMTLATDEVSRPSDCKAPKLFLQRALQTILMDSC